MKTAELQNGKLSLTNSGELQLFFIGVGSAFTKLQYQTNLLVIKGKDHLLIDCGTRAPHALFGLGIPVTDIRNILITHSHADHIGGLEELALMNKYVTKTKPVMVINETYQHILWEMSLRGGIGYNEEVAGDILSFSDIFDVIRPQFVPGFSRETLCARVGGIEVTMMRTMHIPDSSRDWRSSFWSCGVIIDNRIFFPSDTRYDENLIMEYDGRFNFEAIFHDCQFFTGGVHASLDELAKLPDHVKRRIHLSHVGDNWKDNEARASSAGFAGFARQQVYYTF